jgi:hypothetical protein
MARISPRQYTFLRIKVCHCAADLKLKGAQDDTADQRLGRYADEQGLRTAASSASIAAIVDGRSVL